MHDWTLISIIVEWKDRKVVMKFKTIKGYKELVAHNFYRLLVPRNEEWGPSECVYETVGPKSLENGNSYFCLRAQSGDLIELEAKSIIMPELK